MSTSSISDEKTEQTQGSESPPPLFSSVSADADVDVDDHDHDAGLPAVGRSVMFPQHVHVHHDSAIEEREKEKIPGSFGLGLGHGLGYKPKGVGVEMRREMTAEDKELAAAGYEHLESERAKAAQDINGPKPAPGSGSGAGKEDKSFENVDIEDHKFAFGALRERHATRFDAKDAAASPGLESAEAKLRLERDGFNVLTPPKKKSALQKVCVCVVFFSLL